MIFNANYFRVNELWWKKQSLIGLFSYKAYNEYFCSPISALRVCLSIPSPHQPGCGCWASAFCISSYPHQMIPAARDSRVTTQICDLNPEFQTCGKRKHVFWRHSLPFQRVSITDEFVSPPPSSPALPQWVCLDFSYKYIFFLKSREFFIIISP